MDNFSEDRKKKSSHFMYTGFASAILGKIVVPGKIEKNNDYICVRIEAKSWSTVALIKKLLYGQS